MNLRKILAAALSLTMMCSAATTLSYAPMSAFAADPVAEELEETTDGDTVTYPIEAEVDGCQYSVYEDHAVLSQCPDDILKGDYVLPAEVNGVPVTQLNDRLLNFQKELISFTIPATVTKIGNHLSAYSTLEKFIVDKNNPNYCSVDGVIYTKDMATLVAYPSAKPETVFTVPDGVTKIGYGAFYTANITEVKLPDSVKELDKFAFVYCRELEKAELGSSVETLGYHSFWGSAALKSIELPASVKEVNGNVFEGCKSLASLTVMNPNCTFNDNEKTLGDKSKTVIRGYEGSTAQAYAEKYEYQFESIGKAPASTQLVETADIKYGTANPIVKIIGGKPYDIKISGIFSAEGEKALDETADKAKITEIKSGIITSLDVAVKNVDFTAEPASYAAASAMIKEKALSWYNGNYAASTGYKLTKLEIQSMTVLDSGVAAETETSTTTTAAATTTTASVSTTVSTSSLKPKFIYAITFCDADTGLYLKGVQFTLKTNNDEDEDYGTVTAESGSVTLRGYGDRFTLKIVSVPEGYIMPKNDTFKTETIADLVSTIYLSKDGTAYMQSHQASLTTTSSSAGSAATTMTTTTTAPETTTTEATTASAAETTTVTTTSPDPYNPLYVGDWHLQTTDNLPYSLASIDATVSNNGTGSVVLVYTDGARPPVCDLTWTSDGDNVAVTAVGLPYSAKYDSSTDSASVSVGGVELVFVRGKSAQTTTSAETTATTTSASAETATETTTTTAPETTTTAASTTAPASLSEGIVGTWKYTKFTDASGNPSDTLSHTSSDIIFNADGTGKYTVVSTEVTPEDGTAFTWTAEEDTVTVILDDADSDANMLFFTYKDGELTFEREDGVIHFTKEGSSASKLGDVTGDGIVDAKDASAILAEYSLLSTNAEPTFTDAQKKAADVNNDGNTDAKDASVVLAYYSFLSTGGKGSLEEYLAK